MSLDFVDSNRLQIPVINFASAQEIGIPCGNASSPTGAGCDLRLDYDHALECCPDHKSAAESSKLQCDEPRRNRELYSRDDLPPKRMVMLSILVQVGLDQKLIPYKAYPLKEREKELR